MVCKKNSEHCIYSVSGSITRSHFQIHFLKNPSPQNLQQAVLLFYPTFLAHYTPSATLLATKPAQAHPRLFLLCIRLCRQCSGGHQNWRACPRFSSTIWTKWVKLGSSDTKHRDRVTRQWYFSHAQLVSLMCGNCLTCGECRCESGVGGTSGKMLPAYQATHVRSHGVCIFQKLCNKIHPCLCCNYLICHGYSQ